MKMVVSAAFALTALSGTACGQPAQAGLAGDTNGDNALSRAEYLNLSIARFALLDTNGDGRLSRLERTPGRVPNGLPVLIPGEPRRPGDSDADGDQFASRDEFILNLGVIFDRLDKNGDDSLSGSELAASVGSTRGAKPSP